MVKGRMKYIPAVVIDELRDLKLEKGLKSDSEAFREIANYSQIGREVERIKLFRFGHSPRKVRGKKRKGFF